VSRYERKRQVRRTQRDRSTTTCRRSKNRHVRPAVSPVSNLLMSEALAYPTWQLANPSSTRTLLERRRRNRNCGVLAGKEHQQWRLCACRKRATYSREKRIPSLPHLPCLIIAQNETSWLTGIVIPCLDGFFLLVLLVLHGPVN